MKMNTKILAGTTILAALAVVLDYAQKYSSLKIPFPWLPQLKFDFTGIPIVLSTLLFGFVPGLITCLVASLAILARSGSVVSSSMKGLAEFSTILGIIVSVRLFGKFSVMRSCTLGTGVRVIIMLVANFALVYAGIMPLDQTFLNTPLIWGVLVGVFNFLQGGLSAFGGYFFYETIRRRVPNLVEPQTGRARNI